MNTITVRQMGHVMRKHDYCICENKGADQLRSNYIAGLHHCFHNRDSAIHLLLKSEISRI